MVCDDCTKQLSVSINPDTFKKTDGPGAHRAINENKLLRKGIRSNPYGNACKICKLKCQQNNAIYCTICAYAKGLCSICGKQVQDTRMYKMSEGGNGWHTVRERDEKSFKSDDQIAREQSRSDLMEFCASTGSVGRMPTKATFEAAGKKELCATLVRVYGGLYAAADSMSMSKRFLMEEAEERKEEKKRALLAAEEKRRDAAAAAEAGASSTTAAADDEDLPPGVAAGAASTAPAATAPAATAPAPAPAPAPASAAAAGKAPASAAPGSDEWKFDPNSGLFYQLSTMAYYDGKTGKYFKDGKWLDSLS
tara:strand:- start:282 stop:1205 length:924 start_codon:yes stop_codon:yes gene_type:complete